MKTVHHEWDTRPPTESTMTSPYALALLLALLVGQPVSADPLYKWVDSAGRVTYSSTPPPAGTKAEEVEAPPRPSEEEVRQAGERVNRTRARVRELEDERLEQEAAERAREEEEARRREEEHAREPVVIEKPVYVPQPIYYPPAGKRPPPPPIRPPLPQPPVKPIPSPLPTR